MIDTLVRTIGLGIIGLLSIAIPMLTLVSIIEKWHSLIIAVLCILDGIEAMIVMDAVYKKSEKEARDSG